MMSLIDRRLGDFDAISQGFRWRLPSRYNIAHHVCDRHAQQDKVALYWENEAGDSAHYTFGQICAWSNRLANALRGLGVNSGDRVAIILPQRLETTLAHLATYKIGALALPLSVLFGPDALAYRLRDSGAMLAITDRARYPLLESIRDNTPELRHLLCCNAESGAEDFWTLLNQGADSLEIAQTSIDDPAMLIYTSGTTGSPKGAVNAHRCLLGNLPGFEMSHNFFPEQDDLFWTPADWAWTGGLLDALLPAWHYAVPILAYEGGKFDPERTCRLLAKYRVRNAFIPPTALKMLMQLPAIRSRFDVRLRSIMSAGELMGTQVGAWVEQELGIVANEMWGQTEFNYLVGNCAAVMPVRPGSMGKPYPGHVVDIIDEQGQVLKAGEVGELAARRGDPVMFLGYWQNPEATAAKFKGDWFCTGDLGYRDEAGYLWFQGRTDDVISSAGYRIGPGEIEDCLLNHPAVAQVAVIGVPDPLRGQIIKACIVPAPGYQPSDTLREEIRQSVKTRLAAYEYPRLIEFMDDLPMTTSGKIRRIQLRQWHEQGIHGA